MADARLGPIEDFPFVEPPDRSQIRDGLRLLRELNALESGDATRLTPTGRLLARLPVDPRLGRMLVEAGRLGVLRDVLPIVAGLAIPDVRERPTEKQAEADTMHRRFFSPLDAGDTDRDASDIAALHRLWTYLAQRRRDLSGNAFRRMCRDEYLNFLRIREWQDLTSQLREASRNSTSPRAPPQRGRRRSRARRRRTARAPAGRRRDPHRRARRSAEPRRADRHGVHARNRRRRSATPGGVRWPSTSARARRPVRDPARLGGREGRAAAGDGGRARRDQPAVGAHGGPDPRRVGRAGRRTPAASQLLRAALVGQRRPVRGH